MPRGERCDLRWGQRGDRSATLNDPISTMRRNGDIDRNVRPPRLDRGQKSDQHFAFFMAEDGDRRTFAGITLREKGSEPVGSFPQLAVAQRPSATDVSNLIRKVTRRSLDRFDDVHLANQRLQSPLALLVCILHSTRRMVAEKEYKKTQQTK